MKLFIVMRTLLKLLFSSGLFLILMACSSTRYTSNVNNFDELRELINSREFEIESEWANPMGESQIYITTSTNFVRFKGDKVEIFLPYFGVRHSGGGYGSENGIKYEGPANELRINEEINKNRFIVSFRGKHENEHFEFNITLFQNGEANILVNSSQRDGISYRGKIMRLRENEEQSKPI